MSEITTAEQIRLTIIKKVNYDTAAAKLVITGLAIAISKLSSLRTLSIVFTRKVRLSRKLVRRFRKRPKHWRCLIPRLSSPVKVRASPNTHMTGSSKVSFSLLGLLWKGVVVSILNKVIEFLSPSVPEACREENFASVIKNIEILSKDSSELKSIQKERREGKISDEAFIATAVAIITQELLEFRRDRDKADAQAI